VAERAAGDHLGVAIELDHDVAHAQPA